MTDAIDLLPGSSTPLEETLLQMLDVNGRYVDKLSEVAGMGENVDQIPDDWLPWFVYNEGLEILLPFLSMRDALRYGRPWKKELGSEAAIIRALGWLGHNNIKVHYEPNEDEHFDLFQVELSKPISSLTEASQIADLIYLSKASTDILGRVRSGDDGDPFRLDHSELDGPDLLDDWTGIRIPGLGPDTPEGPITWSFGDYITFTTTIADQYITTLSVTETVSMLSNLTDGFVLDHSILDEEVLEPVIAETEIMPVETITISSNRLQGIWPHRAHPGYPATDFAPSTNIKITQKD